MNETCWLFNTDETEAEGEGAHRHMLDMGVIAAWGYCRGSGAEITLNRPAAGDTVFFFLAGHGIIASGQVAGPSVRANTIFDQGDEFHRTVNNLRVLPTPLTVAEIREGSGYDLPCRHIVCRLNDDAGVRFIRQHFQNVPVA